MSSFGPESLPYTTAASEFIYGYSSVLAALKANRRRLYKLYVLPRGLKNEGSSAILSRAASLNVTIQHVDDDYLRAFTKASRGRPHNGFIMETSPLPAPTIFALGPCSVINNEFQVNRAHQSKEEEAVNGKQRIFGYKSHGWRYPLVVYADGVLDEGNLGAIARSAYFLGADAIVTPMRKSAPWSHVAVKASVGAAEAIPIFKVEHPSEFLVNSAREGWRIYASGAIPPAPPVLPSKEHLVTEEEPDSRVVYTFARSGKRLPEKYSPVKEHPSILMMGAEDTGLRESLVSAAHYKVGIRQGREDEVGVDSLNVSVAASLLCFQMLQKPRKSRDALF
ncbi:hypothetical protein DM02DRAFT_519430 [Periconia macrospinosa]|uniref:rRNA methyltransferase 1, mitochondrial n=1 Tax=Periconia macrospinosa TaxID=97972 RepID=A0A2V1E0L5_9PLEO|nr:hypothetical protein DM02DRAFT_519430 [Periconia macrospinosa]